MSTRGGPSACGGGAWDFGFGCRVVPHPTKMSKDAVKTVAVRSIESAVDADMVGTERRVLMGTAVGRG